MAGNFVQFVPSTSAPFSFQPTLNGQQYIATITYNYFGQRYYLNLTDLSQNLILCRGLSPTGPALQAQFAWDDSGTATATTSTAHNVPVGGVVNVYMSQTGSGFDGQYLALSTGAYTLTYGLTLDPTIVQPCNGFVNFAVNLVKDYIAGGWLLYNDSTMQFEF